ncbi:hypothetical protein KR018_006823 [Drosophila ironensis]|nr:hypothetical protein KR018_006823 [Drosophila ironensis]
MWYSIGTNPRMALIRQGYRIIAEYKMVQEELKNIYAIPSFTSGLHWFGVIFVHSGIYAGSMFRFSILLPENFPEDTILPTVIFSTPTFHPHICPQTNCLDLGPCFKEWNKNKNHIWQLLRYIQAIFVDPEGSICTGKSPSGDLIVLDESNNMEALNLLAKSRPEYVKRVQELVTYSQRHMFDKPMTDDPHYIIMEPYSADKHIRIMENLQSRSWREATCEDDSPPAEYLGQIDSSRLVDEDEASQTEKLGNGRVCQVAE